MSATIVSIHIASQTKGVMTELESAQLQTTKGIIGDRYFDKGDMRNVTLVEQESLADVTRDYGIEVPRGATRRNIVTSGIALNHLVGREFSIGEVRLKGTELCEPCAIMERSIGPGA
ncbi:MAG: MOSC domain-containing protein, partial [Myxococcales bacterium]|nr:MOSC domain-containing protein [Myxococcales bacterium]